MRYSDRERRERFALARGFEASGLTKRDYCRQHGLSTGSFDHWLREAAKAEVGEREGSFIEISVADSAPEVQSRQPDLEVELPLGVKLRFFGTAAIR